MGNDSRLEELLAEAHDLQSAGTFDLESFCAAHPGHADDLRAHCAVLDLADGALGAGAVTRAERDRVRTVVGELVAADARRAALKPLEVYRRLFPGFEDLVEEAYRRAPAAGDADAVTVREESGGTGSPVIQTPVGDRLGAYRLEKELGRGGMGVVYLAEDERLRRRVALKVLAPVFATSNVLRERFRREAAVASRLDHTAICTVYDAGEVGGTPFIAMQFVEGRTLEEWIKESRTAAGFVDHDRADRVTRLPAVDGSVAPGAMPAGGLAGDPDDGRTTAGSREDLDRVLRVIERSSRALHHAHEAGLIHRDIKPGNIMITPDGDPVLLDFGLARDDSAAGISLTQTGALMGTPAYMSPEQIAAHRIKLDRRTDVYSLGVTLYEALTLRLPFRAVNRDSLYQKILATDPENPRKHNRTIPDDLRVVIDKALEKDRDRRYSTADELADELARILADEPIRARPPSLATRARRWMRRNPGKAGGTLVVLALAAGVPALVSVVTEQAEQALRDRMETESLLTGREELLRRAKTSGSNDLQQAAMALEIADLKHGVGDLEAARANTEQALGLAASAGAAGKDLQIAIREILGELEAEIANR